MGPISKAQPRRRIVNVGIIGLGSHWETRYQPALETFRQRMNVRAAFDPVYSRVEQVAAELRAIPFQGMKSLADSKEIQALLLLDTSWPRNHSLKLIRTIGKPIYVAGSLGEDATALRQLHTDAIEARQTLMPELSRRYTPATGRLRELIATQLGRPQQITIDAVVPSPNHPEIIPGQGPGIDFLVGLFDWCRYVVRTPPVRIEARQFESSSSGDRFDRTITITYTQPRTTDNSPIAELRIRHEQQGELSGEEPRISPPVRFDIVGEHGSATIHSPEKITWSTGDSEITETLSSDRTEVEVMLDHFLRRVAGGLIPVADILDVSRAVFMAHSAELSLNEGRAVELNDQI